MSNITVKKIHCSVFISIFGIIDFHNTRIFSGILIEICPLLLVIVLEEREVKVFQNNRYTIETGVNHALFGIIEKLKYQRVSHPLLIFPSSFPYPFKRQFLETINFYTIFPTSPIIDPIVRKLKKKKTNIINSNKKMRKNDKEGWWINDDLSIICLNVRNHRSPLESTCTPSHLLARNKSGAIVFPVSIET